MKSVLVVQNGFDGVYVLGGEGIFLANGLAFVPSGHEIFRGHGLGVKKWGK